MLSRVLLIAVLLCFAAFVVAQKRYYVSGTFSRLNRFNRPGYFCFNSTGNTWARNTASQKGFLANFPVHAFLNANEGYYFDNTVGQLFYFNHTNGHPVLENRGSFIRQDTASSNFGRASVSALYINKAQTRLWIIGDMTKIGTLQTNTRGTGQTFDFTRIAAFDISGDKFSPANVPVPQTDGTVAQLTNRAFPQGNNLVILASAHTAGNGAGRLWRIDPAANRWTSITHLTQNANGATFKYTTDESIWAYTTTDLLDQPLPAVLAVSNEIFQRLDPAATGFTKVTQSSTATNPSDRLGSLWAPNANKEVFFSIDSSVLTTTKDVLDAQRQLQQYFYKVREGGQRERMHPDGRFAIANDIQNLGNFRPVSSLFGDIIYDDLNQALVLFGNTVNYFVVGAYQSKVIDTVKGQIPEDRTKYNARLVASTISWIKATTPTGALSVSAAYGGGLDVTGANSFTDLGVRFLPTATCFFGNRAAFDTFSPYVAMFDNNRWQPIPGVTGMFDEDIVNGQLTSVTAIERITTSADEKEAFFAGYFRTLGGKIFNSIFFYNGINAISPLGSETVNGVTQYSNLGDPAAGTTPDDTDYNRYYGLRPGTVNQMVFDSNAKILYVAGSFYRAGSVYVRNIARWNHVTKIWSDLDGGLSGSISKMVLHGGNLYVSGSFTYGGSTHVSNFAMFNVAAGKWESPGIGVSSITDFVSYMGRLYLSVQASSNTGGATFHLGVVTYNGATYSPVFFKLPTSTVESNTCVGGTRCDASGAIFYVIADKLFAFLASEIYILDGEVFRLYQRSTSGITILRNGIRPGTKVNIITSPTLSSIYTDSALDAPSWEYSLERQDVFADGRINVFSSAPKMNISILVLAFVALVMIFFN